MGDTRARTHTHTTVVCSWERYGRKGEMVMQESKIQEQPSPKVRADGISPHVGRQAVARSKGRFLHGNRCKGLDYRQTQLPFNTYF